MSGETDEHKAIEIEEQVLQLWDHIYVEWIKYNSNVTLSSSSPNNMSNLADSWETLVKNSPGKPETS